MKIPFVDLHAQYLSIKPEIDAAIAEVIAESAFVRGRHVETFERAWAKTIGLKHCVSCGNGTDALYISMRALGVKPGDEAVTTPMTFAATANCVLYQGATPVFADVGPDTLNLDPDQFAARIESVARR